MTRKEAYAAFNLPEKATQEQIKGLYKALVNLVHPDHNRAHPDHAGKDTTGLFRVIQQAYEILIGKQQPDAEPAPKVVTKVVEKVVYRDRPVYVPAEPDEDEFEEDEPASAPLDFIERQLAAQVEYDDLIRHGITVNENGTPICAGGSRYIVLHCDNPKHQAFYKRVIAAGVPVEFKPR